MEEVWKDIKGFEGKYQVSSIGRVKSLYRILTRSNGVDITVRERILKDTSVCKKGYRRVSLRDLDVVKKCLVHRLVAEAFIVKVPHKNFVNHKDFNKNNNLKSNLEWCTCKENTKHYLDTVGSGYYLKRSNLTESDILNIKELCEKGYAPKRIKDDFYSQLDIGLITSIYSGTCWRDITKFDGDSEHLKFKNITRFTYKEILEIFDFMVDNDCAAKVASKHFKGITYQNINSLRCNKTLCDYYELKSNKYFTKRLN